jgi:hypothetical protein
MIDDLWYKNGVFYCLSVGTYMDADGDRIGDFKGLLRRLDYLQGLGITTIWLMPFQPSPGKDDGYDISDYYGVDPRYGTLGDFVEFTHGCRQRGLRVIIDLVVNHTSDQHAARSGGLRAWMELSRIARSLSSGAHSRDPLAPSRLRRSRFGRRHRTPMITPSLPRRSSVPSTFSPSLSRNVESRMSPFSPAASEAIETG